MAPSSRLLTAVPLLLILLGGALTPAYADTDGRNRRRHTRLFAFGNSLTDTGNGPIFPVTAGSFHPASVRGDLLWPSQRPGFQRQAYPRLPRYVCIYVINIKLEELKVPEPTPYLAGRTAADFVNGANFALGGATALDLAFLATNGRPSLWLMRRADQRKIMAKSVFYVGEIGVNDYFVALSNNSVDVAVSLVPHIIGAVRSALTAMIAAGARTLVVTGMLPIGCEPQQLALFPGGPGDYDPTTGCITRFNVLAEHHNHRLRMMLRELRSNYGRSLTLLYADIYRPVLKAIASPACTFSATRRWPRAAGAAADPTTSTSSRSVARRRRRRVPTRPSSSPGTASTSPRLPIGSSLVT
ncbi:unnamed protein product [Miscanthus lutarioriparius]|uniref:GDSL esterase/lipase n=1 Tax=Miscanthus lutarioriparius TaxID=422564 RepID=A0A811MCI8_9POAL|nr:unnamed protein product [Miscanthus lutarioriparius]